MPGWPKSIWSGTSGCGHIEHATPRCLVADAQRIVLDLRLRDSVFTVWNCRYRTGLGPAAKLIARCRTGLPGPMMRETRNLFVGEPLPDASPD